MNTNGPTLSDLHDIVMPEPVSAWPPAPGVRLVLIIAVLTATAFLLRQLKTYQKKAYRRAAIAELRHVESAADLGEILRRVAIQARGRETVTNLQGAAWFQWLETEGGLQLSKNARKALESIYSTEEADTAELRTFTEKWIRGHTC